MESRIFLCHVAIVAGAMAGLVTSLLIWLSGASGLMGVMGVRYAQPLEPTWIYQRMVWGGLWGVLFALPWMKTRLHRHRGLIVGLMPSTATLLGFNPFKDGVGLFGLGMGAFWPFLVVLFSILWGYLAGSWLDLVYGAVRALRVGDSSAS